MTKPTENSVLVFKPYVMPSEEVEPKAMQRHSIKAVEDTINDIGPNKTTDQKITDACNRNNVDEFRVRKVAGFDKDGINEYKIVR